jgi:NTE family protein
MSAKNDVPEKQRALVLQGGGALGAYEAGAVSILCGYLSDEDQKNKGKKDGPLFDIIAGTSIGAMNAAVLVSNVVNRKKTWKDATEILERFWTDEAKEEEKDEEKKGGLSSDGRFSDEWWQLEKRQNKLQASDGASRRHYSVKDYLRYGAPNVFFPHIPEFDFKFGDSDNLWFVYDSYPLEQTIKRYSKDHNDKKDDDGGGLRIATSWEQRQPRLLVISTDVAEGKTVAFDSYHREKGVPGNSLYDGGDGITINHIMASGTLPVFYKFREIPNNGGRKFCDGGVLSNTPFRELLQAHRDYWKKVIGEKQDKIPDLDVYIINVHPSKKESVLRDDHDAVKDRINDIIFSDRNSHYDEMVADLVTDYTDLIDKLKELAKNHFKNKDESDLFENEFEDFIKTTQTKSKGASGEDIKYDVLLEGRYKLTKVTRIEPEGPESYTDSISGKVADFTSQTIKNLIEKGKQDARRALKLQ